MATYSHQKSRVKLKTPVTPEIKALLRKAAALKGRNFTDFVVETLQAEAYRVIEEHQTLKLSLEDSKAFVDAVLNPPEPNPALQSAARRYKQEIEI